MKMLICGAGWAAGELLRRLGERWEVVLVDKSRENLDRVGDLFPNILSMWTEDPSSALVLQRAGLEDMDYVLSLADDDGVNLAVGQIALEQGIRHVLALVHDTRLLPEFQEKGIQTLLAGATLAREINHYLEDPSSQVTSLGLGRAAVMEVEAALHPGAIGKASLDLKGDDWRLVGIIRNGTLLFPDRWSIIQAEDRLIIIGGPDLFEPVCDSLECGLKRYPLTLGRELLIALWPEPGAEFSGVLSEGLYWASNTKASSAVIICDETNCDIQDQLDQWPAALELRVETARTGIGEMARELCRNEPVSLVMVNRFELSFLQSMARSTLTGMAESLGRPLLLSSGVMPYRKILAPFNGSPKSEIAAETAIELAFQFEAELSFVVVEEPRFLRGETSDPWLEEISEKIREMAHLHKIEIEEIVLNGNPVKEIVRLSKDFDLMVVGAASEGRGFLAPNVGEHLAQKAACSVLLTTG